MSFRYISRISSFEARVFEDERQELARAACAAHERARALFSVQPSNCGSKTLRTSCWVMVLVAAIARAAADDVREDRADQPIGSTPG